MPSPYRNSEYRTLILRQLRKPRSASEIASNTGIDIRTVYRFLREYLKEEGYAVQEVRVVSDLGKATQFYLA